MARPGGPERNRVARSFRQLRRFRHVINSDRVFGIHRYLAKPEGAGPFPAVIGLHGCGGMSDTTKRKLADELVGWGYVVLLVDSFATRGAEHACTGGYSDIAGMRRSDASGALAFLARPT